MAKKDIPSCFVASIDLSLEKKLREDLIRFGYEMACPPHTFFSAKKKGISISLYQSGKLTVQGKESREFIEFYLEPEILKNFSYSHPEEYTDKTPHIGSDETGKGDFFGPLCIAAVYADEERILQLLKMGIKDSKKLSDKKCLELAKTIERDFAHHVVLISPLKYNELYPGFGNLNTLLAWGHASAIAPLTEKTGCRRILIDQFASEKLIENAVRRKVTDPILTLRHRAEEDPVVAAAAVLARARFLRSLKALEEKIGLPLPKGASELTKKACLKIIQTLGTDILDTLCKKHFVTYREILGAQKTEGNE